MFQQRIAVIGAGIVGICQALYLQRAGYQVSLFDRRGIAEECSKGNAGHFATEQVFPLADPALLPQLAKILLDPKGPFRVRPTYFFKALPWFMRFLNNMRPGRMARNRDAIKALNERAIEAYQPLLREAGLEHMLRLNGSLLVYERDIDAEIEHQYRSFKEQQVGVELLGREGLLQLEPKLSQRVKSGLYFTDVGHTTEPGRFSKLLAGHFLAQGGEFHQIDIDRINDLDHCVELLAKPAVNNLLFDKVVVCTGAWSKSLLEPMNYRVPLDTERGYHLMLPQKSVLSRPVASAERKFIMTPMETGLRLAGTVEFAGLEAAADYNRAKILLPHSQALLADQAFQDMSADSESLPSWMGFRPSLPDSLPVMGRAPRHPNVFFNFAHQHLGLTWGAVCGQQMTALISGRAGDINLGPSSPYRINRF